MLSETEARTLLARAREARAAAYAPYSGFPVGAALLDADGVVHAGANVENASYGLTICAERAAVFRAIGERVRSFRAIAIVGPDDDQPCAPCGACRQVLHEFAPDLIVCLADPSGSVEQLRLPDLLPRAFGPEVVREQNRERPRPTRPDSSSRQDFR